MGYAVVGTEEPADLQYLTTAYAPACLAVEPVVHVPDAVLAGTRGRDLTPHDGQDGGCPPMTPATTAAAA